MQTRESKLKLTRRQVETLQFIDDCVYMNGYPPTIREIGSNMGINSPNGVVGHLVALEKKGYIRRAKLSRSITIVKPVPRDTMTVEIRVTCSRCGIKLLEDRVIYQVRVGNVRQPKPAVDFCDECHTAFKAWLDRGAGSVRPKPQLPGQLALFADTVREAEEKF